eukprot:TRINITY_DN12711_c0_g1_i5.p1 TRINITY_DN12711_c0_g1~~TRINITY_DN12711_c0_g1_i5.p1  ORF type:complete len:1085 (+),score=79.15 TRINITY_DN12711_c0_g1_i5:321-3575(+)
MTTAQNRVVVRFAGPPGIGKTSLVNSWYRLLENVEVGLGELSPSCSRAKPVIDPARLSLNVYGTRTTVEVEESRTPYGIRRKADVYVLGIAGSDLKCAVPALVSEMRHTLGMMQGKQRLSNFAVVILKSDLIQMESIETAKWMATLKLFCLHHHVPLFVTSSKTLLNTSRALKAIVTIAVENKLNGARCSNEVVRWKETVAASPTSHTPDRPDGTAVDLWNDQGDTSSFFYFGFSNLIGRSRGPAFDQAPPRFSLGADLGKALVDQSSADVAFVIEGQTVFAHKAILLARSPTFRQMFAIKSELSRSSRAAHEHPNPVEAMVAAVTQECVRIHEVVSSSAPNTFTGSKVQCHEGQGISSPPLIMPSVPSIEHPASESITDKESIHTIDLPAMKLDVFNAILTTIYTGVCPRLDKELAWRLRPVADLYQLNSLTVLCDLWLDTVNAVISIHNFTLEAVRSYLRWSADSFDRGCGMEGGVNVIKAKARSSFRKYPLPGKIFSCAMNYINSSLTNSDDQVLELIAQSSVRKLKNALRGLIDGKGEVRDHDSESSSSDPVQEVRKAHFMREWLPAVRLCEMDWYKLEDLEPLHMHEELYIHLWNKPDSFADIAFHVSDGEHQQVYYAHQVVLRSRWRNFDDVLHGRGGDADCLFAGPCPHGHSLVDPTLCVRNITWDAFQALLGYTYLGDIPESAAAHGTGQPSLELSYQLYDASQRLGMRELYLSCEKILCGLVSTGNAQFILGKVPPESLVAAHILELLGLSLCPATTDNQEPYLAGNTTIVDWTSEDSIKKLCQPLGEMDLVNYMQAACMGDISLDDIRTVHGESLLHFASAKGAIALVTFLLSDKGGAHSPLEEDLYGVNAMEVAVCHQQADVLEVFVDHLTVISPHVDIAKLWCLTKKASIVNNARCMTSVLRLIQSVSTKGEDPLSHVENHPIHPALFFNSASVIAPLYENDALGDVAEEHINCAIQRCSHDALSELFLQPEEIISWDSSTGQADSWVTRVFELAWTQECAFSVILFMVTFFQQRLQSQDTNHEYPWDTSLSQVYIKQVCVLVDQSALFLSVSPSSHRVSLSLYPCICVMAL